LLAALILVAFIFGGGGIGSGLANLAVQLTALAVLAWRWDAALQFWRGSPMALRLLIIATVGLPLLQTIPLPEPIWSALPGRALVSDAVNLAGGSDWRTFSVSPLRTMLAMTTLVTPLAVLFAGWALPRERLIDCGWAIVALGLVTVLLGAVQLSSGTEAGTLYGSRAPGKILLGTFANRNSTGLFLTFTLALAALLPVPRPHPAILPARLAVCALLLLAVVVTQSRTSLVLAILPVLLGMLRAISTLSRTHQRGTAARTSMIAIGALALLGTAAGAVLVTAPSRIGATLERFEAKDDPRRFIWDDATYSAQRYWPLGAGTGTFDELYQVDESLENLTERRAGRVHNDYIELTIESGAPGLVLAALWLVLIGWLSWRVRISSQRWSAWAGSAFLLAIALQSITDYPLRNQTMLAFAAFALLLLARIAFDQRSVRA
jgi:O-antigen ligase